MGVIQSSVPSLHVEAAAAVVIRRLFRQEEVPEAEAEAAKTLLLV